MSSGGAFDLVEKSTRNSDGRTKDLEGYEGEGVGGRLTGRLGTFSRDFYRGYAEKQMDEEVLASYTWSNLGWRLGTVFAATKAGPLTHTEQARIAKVLFSMLSDLQREWIEWHNDDSAEKLPTDNVSHED